MKWQRGHRSSNVEDGRGQRPPRRAGSAVKLGGGSAVLIVILALIARAAGVDLGLGGSSGGGANPASSEGGSAGPPGPPGSDPDAELVEFIHFVIDDIQLTMAGVFRDSGHPWRDAKLRIFTSAVDTGCGLSSAEIGPFYCPPDEKAYIDLSFYRDLRQRFGAPGDFAQAYVLAHEIGHHAQHLLGVDDRVRREAGRDRARRNALGIRQELQADCLAGVWAHSTARRQLLEAGDLEESLTAAAAIGDDRLQKMAGQRVDAETWTHGSSAQRVKWFRRGFERGTLDACDTFSVAQP